MVRKTFFQVRSHNAGANNFSPHNRGNNYTSTGSKSSQTASMVVRPGDAASSSHDVNSAPLVKPHTFTDEEHTQIMVIGSYVGIATVGIFIVWYTQASFLGINIVSNGYTLVELSQLRNWGEGSAWPNFTVSPFKVGNRLITFSDPCEYFTVGKVKALTLSLSVLVAIEMFNSLNALSEDNSLIKMPPWRNPWLLISMSASLGGNSCILFRNENIFGVTLLRNFGSYVACTCLGRLLVITKVKVSEAKPIAFYLILSRSHCYSCSSLFSFQVAVSAELVMTARRELDTSSFTTP
ncbi:Calcium-transporting ATPase 2, endoplasmic reticulum-type [Capsicum chinense]|nr:Calcium-transporting ATPase 2, endoplasmic reticulum-type [Capsicum chinense]